ncbi:ABC transporter substrate-binding protein [Mucilaginibacter ginsenosidivorax]|uniref:ABC transporter substrate-binding protein n=1 Tax=Mucilaginibacter ginsenosidivorax TaxID=862126 RepID=A0A5B8WDG1_9SPHI|nr:helical backbone metal receptor [Mucilaginibacter ginsenosidivorax]QEC79958.1 ABC transporter substrate-binding protein [Mucilaginibacter ginsenosidivorax]
MAVFRDQLNRVINLPSIPKRIVSVVPSQTELLFYFGLNVEIVGITKFCIHPEAKVKEIAKVGGTKQLNIELIKSLRPDLIIANKEENDRGQVEELMDVCPVWVSDIYDLETALTMIEGVGDIVGKGQEAYALNLEIRHRFDTYIFPPLNITVAYFIWKNPYMVAGRQTYIDSLLQKCGLTNTFESERYPEVSPDDLAAANPNVIFLSSEPYPFKQKHVHEFKQLVPKAKAVLVDGEMFSWYGSRLLQVPGYLRRLLNEIILLAQ